MQAGSPGRRAFGGSCPRRKRADHLTPPLGLRAGRRVGRGGLFSKRAFRRGRAGPATSEAAGGVEWQTLEVRKGQDADPLKQYLWDLRYIDAPVARWYDSDLDGTVNQIWYYTTDANMNVTAMVAYSNGVVAERYAYDPYGRVTVLNGAEGVDPDVDGTTVCEWDPDSTGDGDGRSDVDNRILYCGYRLDPETGANGQGIMHVRHRPYHCTLGRWTVWDFEGYVDGMTFYGYVSGNPLRRMDPAGLWYLDGNCMVMEKWTPQNQESLWSLAELLYGSGTEWREFGLTRDEAEALQPGSRIDVSEWLNQMYAPYEEASRLLKRMLQDYEDVKKHCCSADAQRKRILADWEGGQAGARQALEEGLDYLSSAAGLAGGAASTVEGVDALLRNPPQALGTLKKGGKVVGVVAIGMDVARLAADTKDDRRYADAILLAHIIHEF